jgi:hypothetical protein
MITKHNFLEILTPVSSHMSDSIFETFELLQHPEANPDAAIYEEAIEMLDAWYIFIKDDLGIKSTLTNKEIDYIAKYNLIGFNIESKVQMIKSWHTSYGNPLTVQKLGQTMRHFIYMNAEIYSFSPSTIRAILNNVLLIDSKE